MRLLEKMHSCENNLEKSCTEKKPKKKTKHTLSGYSIFTIVPLTQPKLNLIVTKAKTIWKGFVKTYKNMR